MLQDYTRQFYDYKSITIIYSSKQQNLVNKMEMLTIL